MNYGIKLPPGHQVRVYRTYEPLQVFEIVNHLQFRGDDGKINSQQDVFGRTFDRVDVIDPITGQIIQY